MITKIESNVIGGITATYINSNSHSFTDCIFHLIKHKKRLRSMTQSIQSRTTRYFQVYSNINNTEGRRMANRIDHLVKLKLAHCMDELVNSHT